MHEMIVLLDRYYVFGLVPYSSICLSGNQTMKRSVLAISVQQEHSEKVIEGQHIICSNWKEYFIQAQNEYAALISFIGDMGLLNVFYLYKETRNLLCLKYSF